MYVYKINKRFLFSQVSGEAPAFQTVAESGQMIVVGEKLIS